MPYKFLPKSQWIPFFNIIKGKPGCVGSPQNSCANNLEMAGSPDFGADPPWIPSGSPSAPKQIPWSSPCIFSAVNPFFANHSPRMHRRHTHTFRRPPCFFTRFWILLGKARQSASTSRLQLISSQHAFKREAYSYRVYSQGFAGNVRPKRLRIQETAVSCNMISCKRPG